MSKRPLKPINVKYVGKISRKIIESQNMQKKPKHILVPCQRYKDIRHILQNTKVPKNVFGFKNHAQRSTPPYYLDVDSSLHRMLEEQLVSSGLC